MTGPSDRLIDSNNNATEVTAGTVLRKLALKANGLTGADIERLVREARQKARRQQRGLHLSDMLEILTAAKPVKPEALRWRMAVHEAGHALATVALKLGTIVTITIDATDGSGYVEGRMPDPQVESEAFASDLLVSRLAGRAAEEVVLGFATAGSGGPPTSDLARATALALAMETEMGFSKERPLLYRQTDDRATVLTYHPLIAECVNARLEQAYAKACELIKLNRDAHETLAQALMEHDTLEGAALNTVVSSALGTPINPLCIPTSAVRVNQSPP